MKLLDNPFAFICKINVQEIGYLGIEKLKSYVVDSKFQLGNEVHK